MTNTPEIKLIETADGPKRTMTVAGLIAALQDMDPESPVLFAYPSGDHWRTVCAGRVKQPEEGQACWSGYHREFALAGEHDKETFTAVILQ